jgi:ATP-binding cassette subfamily F protein 3
VVISHDRYFDNRIATSIGEVGGGRIEVIPGDYDAYLEAVAARAATAAPATPRAGETRRSDHERAARRLEAEARNRRYRERKAAEAVLAPIEAEIAALEERFKAAEAAQADPEVYAHPARAREVAREKADAEARLADLYARWESAAADIGE